MALGATGAAVVTARQIIPAAGALLASTGPVVPLPDPKPNAFVDEEGRSLVTATISRDPAEGARRAVDLLGGLARASIAGRQVLILPATATRPAALEAVIRLAQDLGARDVLVGSVPGQPWRDPTAAMTHGGLLDVVDHNGARFVDLRHDQWVTMHLGARARSVASASIPRSISDAEVLIGMAALVPDAAPSAPSLVLWGSAVHPRTRLAARAARDPAGALAALNLAFRPDLMLLDAPDPATGDLFLASGDRVAIDACAVAIRGGHPWQTGPIRAAIALGLGAAGPERMRLVLDPEQRADPAHARLFDDVQRRTGITAG